MNQKKPKIAVGDFVRFPAQNGRRHYGRGRVVSIAGDFADVLPFPRHRRTERFPISELRVWKSADSAAKSRRRRLVK